MPKGAQFRHHVLWQLICVYIVCSGLSVCILRVNTLALDKRGVLINNCLIPPRKDYSYGFDVVFQCTIRVSGGKYTQASSRPRWLSWMRRPTGDQEVAGSTPAEVGNILSRRLIMKYFLRSFSPFR